MDALPADGACEFGRRALLGLAAGAGIAALTGCGLLGDDTRCEIPTPGSPPDPGVDLGMLDAVGVGQAVMVGGPGCASAILARPQDGAAVAFHAICPHKGIPVVDDGGEWLCPAHGARFDRLTGEVREGPATEPLAPIDIQVVDGRVVPRS